MAALVRHVIARSPVKSAFSSLKYNLGSIHTLFTNAAIGLDGYESVRNKVGQQFRDLNEQFRVRMKQSLASDTELIFTEDLKNMLHLVQNDPADLELCTQMIHKFNTQNKEMRFGTYTFGPVVMRALHYLNQPDIAHKLVENEELKSLFDHITSYLILMDLLYKHHQYKDVIKVFEAVQERQLYGTKYPKDCMILLLAACYKLNTPESFEYAVNVIKAARDSGAIVVRRACVFGAALALKQNSPQVAMEVLSISRTPSYVTIRALRLMALADMDRVTDALMDLQSMLEMDGPSFQWRPNVFQDTLDKISAAVKRDGSKELVHRYQQVEKGLRERKLISEESLESMICSPILPRVFADQNGQPRLNVQRNRNSFYGNDPEARTFRTPQRARRSLTDFDE